MSTAQTQAFSYDPFAKEVMNNPLPFYKELRRNHPVYYKEEYDTYFFSRFADIVELLSHVKNELIESEGSLPTPEILRTKNDGAPELPSDDPLLISQRYGMPVYGEVRRAHIKPLMPRQAEETAEFVRTLANERLDELLPKKRFNLTRDYGGIVSASMVMKLMGMPLELAAQSLDMVNAGTQTDPEKGGVDSGAAARKIVESYIPYVQARFDAGADGSVPMVDGMINYRYNGRPLTVQEVATQLVCAFLGGIETVPKVVAHGLMELAARPDQLAAVRENLDENAPLVAEEMIRYCAPAQWFMRTVHKPLTVAGQKMEPGQRAIFLIGSANRDEDEFENPDEFIWNRPIKRTLAFGHGVHFCIGTHLARVEIRELVKAFLKRVDKFSFDMEHAERPPSSFQWGWNTLPVIIE